MSVNLLRGQFGGFRAKVAILCALAMVSNVSAQMGHVLESVGPVNQSMGGAATAMPLDGMSAIQWNPASISGLSGSEIGFAFTVLAPNTDLSSSVEAGAFGPFGPAGRLSGTSESNTDISPMPSFGFVFKPEDSPWTFGLGGSAIAGFGVDYAASSFDPNDTNPFLTPQPGTGNGYGMSALYSSFQMLQISPVASYQLSSKWSVAVSPNFNWTSLGVSPWPATTPNADQTYPSGAHADARWGLGISAGAYWEDCCSGWKFGVSYKSTQWIDHYNINAMDENGFPRLIEFDMDYPAIVSLGLGYSGIEYWDFAWDVRMIDYANTDGFEVSGYDQFGAVRGFGWNSILTTSVGAQCQLTENVRWRVGYTFNESPIGGDVAFFNAVSPAIVKHHLSTGLSYDFDDRWSMAIAYTHGFNNEVTGPWQGPQGPIPGTSVTHSLSTHFASFGIQAAF